MQSDLPVGLSAAEALRIPLALTSRVPQKGLDRALEMHAGNGDVKVDTTGGKIDFDGSCGGEGEVHFTRPHAVRNRWRTWGTEIRSSCSRM